MYLQHEEMKKFWLNTANLIKVQNASGVSGKKKTSLFSISVTFMYLEMKIHLN